MLSHKSHSNKKIWSVPLLQGTVLCIATVTFEFIWKLDIETFLGSKAIVLILCSLLQVEAHRNVYRREWSVSRLFNNYFCSKHFSDFSLQSKQRSQSHWSHACIRHYMNVTQKGSVPVTKLALMSWLHQWLQIVLSSKIHSFYTCDVDSETPSSGVPKWPWKSTPLVSKDPS